MLIEHYKQHQQESGNQQLGFKDFLIMHYGDASSHKQEENHEDLPLFHSCCVSVLFITNQTELTLLMENDQPRELTTEVKNGYDYSRHHTIFQPPRIA